MPPIAVPWPITPGIVVNALFDEASPTRAGRKMQGMGQQRVACDASVSGGDFFVLVHRANLRERRAASTAEYQW